MTFSGYESEVIQLLSRIEKNSSGCGVLKHSMHRSSPAYRRQRELKRLEFGVNYDRISASSSGLLGSCV